MSTFMKSGRISTLVCPIAALLLASCSGAETASDGHDDDGVHWGYQADNGPDVQKSAIATMFSTLSVAAGRIELT